MERESSYKFGILPVRKDSEILPKLTTKELMEYGIFIRDRRGS